MSPRCVGAQPSRSLVRLAVVGTSNCANRDIQLKCASASAFGTSIHEFQALKNDEPGNTRYFSHTTAPTLPAAIAPYVIDVTGLESFTKPQPRILTPSLCSVIPPMTMATRHRNSSRA